MSSNISEVILPSTLRKLGEAAFESCHNLKKVIIPDGVMIIPHDAFWNSGLEEVTIPDSVWKIGDYAFKDCRMLKKIDFSNFGYIEIGRSAFTGCEAFVDENGFFILQNRVFTYHSDTKNPYVVIPDGVTKIELGAFDHSGQIHLDMSINCPSWVQAGVAKMYGDARSLLDYTGSSISFRDAEGNKIAYIVLSNEDETEPKKHGAVLSIKSKNGKFDFAGYDAYFASLAKAPNKIQVALARLEYPYELSNEMLDVYQSFLKRQAVVAGKMLIDDDRLETLEMLGEKHLLTASAVTKLIEYANSKDKVAITAWLLEYNHKTYGKSSGKKTETFAGLSKITPIKTAAEPVKSAAEWRKTFKFKYKDGGVIITGYLGTDECVTIPEKIGDKYVIGLGRGAFERIGFDGASNKTTKKIIVPSTITSIESHAFWIVEGMEIEIQEGIKELPEWAIDVVSNITVKLPASLESIGEQFGDSITESIKMIVPENSCAEEFCKKYSLSYTTYIPVISADAGKGYAIKEQLENEMKQIAKKKAVTPWKKPKAGTHLIPRYLGQDTEVVFPTDVDGISINGIANTSGDTPDNYKAITAVVIPEGYTYIGNKAFAGCVNLETIELPSTLKEIGTQAFAGCKKLKEIIIRKDIAFVGKNTFAESNIGTVVIETEKKTKIPSHLFYGCHVDRLVVVGGPFKSSGNVFDYDEMMFDGNLMYDGNFPVAVYMNGYFNTLDIKGTGGSNAKKIHPLAEFDESVVLNSDYKNIISEEKKKAGKVAYNFGKVAETWDFNDIDSIVFADKIFVLTGFGASEEATITNAIVLRGGVVKSSVVVKTDYVIVMEDYDHKTIKYLKAKEMQDKGKNIAVISSKQFYKLLEAE